MQCTVDSTSVPTKQPADAAVAERIRTLAAHVCRNGPQFEAMVRTKEADNETFSFLNGGDGAAFYQWTLFCMLKGYSPDDVERVGACNELIGRLLLILISCRPSNYFEKELKNVTQDQ